MENSDPSMRGRRRVLLGNSRTRAVQQQPRTVSGLLGTGLALGRPLSGALLCKTLAWLHRGRPSGQRLPCQGLSAPSGAGLGPPPQLCLGADSPAGWPSAQEEACGEGLPGPCGRQSPTFGDVGIRGPESALGSSSVRSHCVKIPLGPAPCSQAWEV